MILITGGLGFLGARIAKDLLQNGYHLRIASTRSKTISLPIELKDCEFSYLDLTKKEVLDEICKDISCIIHLAALNAASCIEDPEQANVVNSLGTYNLLESAKKAKVDRFIYFSTAHVYGSPLVGTLDEKSKTQPTHPYSITHKLAEDYLLEATKDSNIKGTIFRLSNAVGSPLIKETNCWMLVVNDLAQQILTSNKMIFRSSKYELRDFIPISDICNAINYEMGRKEASNFDLFNLGSSKSMTLGELANLMAKSSREVLSIDPEIVFLKENDGTKFDKLVFSNKRILDLGFTISGNIEKEINQLLINTKQWFSSEFK